jgi:hypothetical protein
MLDLPIIYNDNPQQEQVINQCIVEVSEAYRVDPLLMRAIREHERGDVGKKNQNSDGSWDMGPFQINTVHLPELWENFRITKHEVMHDPCINAAVAAWHLRNKINEVNGNIWKGVAWYHSKTDHPGDIYQGLVVDKYRELQEILIETDEKTRLADREGY